MTIRLTPRADLAQLLVINNAATPHVNGLTAPELDELWRQAVVCLSAEVAGEVAGFLLALDQRAVYASENYHWFVAHLPSFIYVDRIAVGAAYRGQGVGQAMYHELFRAARELGHEQVTCEVNVQPPNPASLRFHAQLGFRELGHLRHERDDKVVALLALQVGTLGTAATAPDGD